MFTFIMSTPEEVMVIVAAPAGGGVDEVVGMEVYEPPPQEAAARAARKTAPLQAARAGPMDDVDRIEGIMSSPRDAG
jgi:hypothetical protein